MNISLDFGPVLSSAVIYGAALVGVAVLVAGGFFGFQWLRGELLRRRRRPASASPKRSMVIIDGRRRPFLEGDSEPLQQGDFLEIKWPGGAGAGWIRCELRQVDGQWSFVASGGRAVLAFGQMARWPRAPSAADPKEAELLRRLKGCRTRCPAMGRADQCAETLCDFKWEKQKLARKDNLSPAIKRLLE